MFRKKNLPQESDMCFTNKEIFKQNQAHDQIICEIYPHQNTHPDAKILLHVFQAVFHRFK